MRAAERQIEQLRAEQRPRENARRELPEDRPDHRIVRVVRDYGMFDRRESPQYYPAIDARPAE